MNSQVARRSKHEESVSKFILLFQLWHEFDGGESVKYISSAGQLRGWRSASVMEAALILIFRLVRLSRLFINICLNARHLPAPAVYRVLPCRFSSILTTLAILRGGKEEEEKKLTGGILKIENFPAKIRINIRMWIFGGFSSMAFSTLSLPWKLEGLVIPSPLNRLFVKGWNRAGSRLIVCTSNRAGREVRYSLYPQVCVQF